MSRSSETPPLQLVRECSLLARRWRTFYNAQIRASGLTLARVTVLYWLDALSGTATQRELADIVGIEGPTLVRQLHALEQSGLIERVSNPTDRRANSVRLTPAAEPVLAQIHVMNDHLSREALKALDGRRLASATKLIMDARAALP